MRYGIIYKATSPSGKVYIGQTIGRLEDRINRHRREAQTKHYAFANALIKYGSAIVWEVLYSNVPEDQLDNMERWVIANYDSYDNGYNSTLGGDDNPMKYEGCRLKVAESKRGKKLPDVSARMKLNVGKKASEESKQKMSEAHKGRTFTAEHKSKISEALTGRQFSAETRAKISEAAKTICSEKGNGFLGKKHTEEAKRRMSEAARNRNMSGEHNPNYGRRHSKEEKAKISEANKGRVLSEEHKVKISAAGMGRRHSDETRKKMSGENSVVAKLTAAQVEEIRSKYPKVRSYKKLAEEYGVSRSTIARIVKFKGWRAI